MSKANAAAWQIGEAKYLTLHLTNHKTDEDDWLELPEQLVSQTPRYRFLLYLVLAVPDSLTFLKTENGTVCYVPTGSIEDQSWRDDLGELIATHFKDDLAAIMPPGAWQLGIRARENLNE
jgi:hypothetical protein